MLLGLNVAGGTLICFYVFVSDGGENCHLGAIQERVHLLILVVSYLLRLLGPDISSRHRGRAS